MKKQLLILVALVVSMVQLHAAHLKDNLLFSAKLEGANEVPAVTTFAKGIASFMLNSTRDSISVNISANGLSGAITGIHIHGGAAGTNGGVLIDLSAFINGNRVSTVLTGMAVTANLVKMIQEGLYVNIHTAANPNGEIRGQIKLETDWNFSADMNGANESPAVAGTAYALGSFNLSLHRGIMRFNIVCQGLTGAIGGAHLHFGAAGKNGAVTEDLSTFINGNVISGSITPSAATLDSLFAGKIYINVHTAANPNGEVRAQLLTSRTLNFDANFTGAQEVPAVVTTARAISIIRFNAKMDTLSYDIVVNGLSGAIGGAHFHDGALAVNGPVVLDISSSVNGNRIKGFVTGASLDYDFVSDLLVGNLYINIHTAANPNGEVRGQVFRLAREGYTINMNGMQEVPMLMTMAYGSGIVSVSREQDNAHYMWVVGGLSNNATGAHFHNAVAGQNGGVVYDMSTLMSASGNNASAFGYWKSSDATPFLTKNSVQFRKDSIYINVHNATNPNGEVRGQVRRGQVIYNNMPPPPIFNGVNDDVSIGKMKDNLLFSAKLEGANEVPAVTTISKGIASLMLNKTRDTIAVNISINALSGTLKGIHIHSGVAGANGGVLIDLTPFIVGNKVSTKLFGNDVKANLVAMFSEGLYINAHTAANPNGEVRGQIKLETDFNFVADMSGSKEVPAVVGNAFGLGSFNLSLDRSTMRFNIVCQNMTGMIGGAHLHFGAAGKNGAVTEDLSALIKGNTISGTISPSAATLDSLFVGKIYINVHTMANAGGEIRAQLTTSKTLNFDATLNGAKEVPTVMSPSNALAVIRLNSKMDTLSYDLVASGFNGPIGGAHFHTGAVGTNGGVTFDISSSIKGSRIKGIVTGATLTPAAINSLLRGEMYINLHTMANPNGEIRGQVFRLAREGYTINMTGKQEVPSVPTNAYGSGIVSVNREQDNAHYMWVVGDLTATATGSHFHKGVTGQNGPVIYNMSPLMSAVGKDASAFGYWKSTSATPFTAKNANQFAKDSVYFNIHNTTNPNGEIRGQALSGQVYYVTTVGVNDLFADNTLFSVNPNPTQGFIRLDIQNQDNADLFISVIDVTGRTVYSEIAQNTGNQLATSIDMSSFNNGLYFVNISNGKSILTKKIVKN